MPRLSALRKQALDDLMKEALFQATVGVLRELGVSGLTMDRVAAEAGMAKGSLYRYFPSKRELLEFAYAKLVAPVFRELEILVKQDKAALHKLADQLRSLLEHVGRNAEVHHLLFDDDAAKCLLQSSERKTHETASQLLAQIFEQGIAEGVFQPADPALIARMYLGLLRAVFEGRPNLSTAADQEEIRRTILETFLGGILTDRQIARDVAAK